jgi:hypothetical protein
MTGKMAFPGSEWIKPDVPGFIVFRKTGRVERVE